MCSSDRRASGMPSLIESIINMVRIRERSLKPSMGLDPSDDSGMTCAWVLSICHLEKDLHMVSRGKDWPWRQIGCVSYIRIYLFLLSRVGPMPWVVGARLGHRGQRRLRLRFQGRAGGVRPSSRWATDGACDVEVRCANITTNKFVSKEL